MQQLTDADGTYVSMSRLRVDADRSDELVEAFRNRVGLVDGADGFRGLQVWRSDADECEVVMVSFWDTRAAFRAYMKSDQHRVSHERISPQLQDAISLQRLEHLRTYDIVAR